MRIKKLDYSRNPWRLVLSDGREVWAHGSAFDQGLGRECRISSPVAGQTKKECTENALAMLERFLLDEEEGKRNATTDR